MEIPHKLQNQMCVCVCVCVCVDNWMMFVFN